MRLNNSLYRLTISLIFFVLVSGIEACEERDGDSDTDEIDTGDTDTNEPDAAPDDESLRGRCDAAIRLGGFEVASFLSASSVQGVVSDGVVPGTVPELVFESENCRLLRTPNPVCDPPCEPGDVCESTNTCVPYPQQMDVGVVTVNGLNTEVEMTPVAPGNNYFAVDLPHPICEEGKLVQLSTTDGFLGVFKLTAMGVENLEVADEKWTVSQGQGISVNWNTPPSDGQSNILMRLSIDQHGASPLRLECEVPDNGHYDVPAEIIDELLGGGITGLPSASLMRFTGDKVGFEQGCVDFSVFEMRTVTVDVVL